MRALIGLAALATLAAPAFAEAHEAQTHRFGSTYATPAASSASACAALCSGDARCMAWTYIKPVATSANRCELKLSEGVAEHNPMAVSGLSPRSPLAKIKADIALRRAEPAQAKTPPLPKYYASALQELPIYTRPNVRRAALPAAKSPLPKRSRIVPVGEAPVVKSTTAKANVVMGAPERKPQGSPYVTRVPKAAAPKPPRPMPKPLKPQRTPDTSKALEVLNSVPVAKAPALPAPPQARPVPQRAAAPAPAQSAPTVRYETTAPPAAYPATRAPAPVAAKALTEEPIVRLGADTQDAPAVVSPYYGGRSTVTAEPPAPVTLGPGNVEISPPPPAAKPAPKTPAGTRVIPSDPEIMSQYYPQRQAAPVVEAAEEKPPAGSLLRGALKP